MSETNRPDLRRLADLTLNHSRDAIFWILDDRIIHANQSACCRLGYSLNELTKLQFACLNETGPDGSTFRWPPELEREGSVVLDSVHQHRNGNFIPVEVSATLHDVDGDRLVCVAAREVHQRQDPVDDRFAMAGVEIQNTVRRLQQSEKRYRSLADTHFDVIITSEDGIVREVSEGFQTLSGYTPEDVLNLRLTDLLTPESDHAVQSRIASDEDAFYELTGRRKDGTPVDIEVVGRTILQDARKLRLSAIRDISRRKRYERELIASQKRSELAMEGGRLGTFEWIPAGGAGEVSDSCYRLFGRTPRSIKPTYAAFARHAHPDDLQRLERVFGVARRSGRAISQEARIYRPDGSMHWIEIRARFAYDTAGEAIRLDGVMIDIDDKKAAEKRFQTSQLNLALALESGNMGTCEWNVSTNVMELSPSAMSITGWPIDGEPVCFRTWIQHIHRGDRAHVVKEALYARRHKGDVVIEFRQMDPDGQYRWLEARGRFAYGANGQATRVSGVIVNIDRRKQAEEELRLRRFAVDVAAEAMFTIRTDGSIVDVNQTACDRLGYTRDELLQLKVSDFSKMAHERFSEHVDVMRKQTSCFVQTIHQRKDGSTLDVEISARLFNYEGREYICATARDVSELRSAEAKTRELDQQLAHMNRLSGMGEMASAIAHELNQPLYVISNLATILQHNQQRAAVADDDEQQIIETIQSQAMLAGEIVRRMRGFCLNKPPSRTVADLQELITESMRLLEPKFRHSGVKTDVEFKQTPPALIDRVQIQQVLVNLVHNAIEAMEDVPEQDRYLSVRCRQHNHTIIRISITDQGPGIAIKERARLFEPFVSTKANGMGMGLAISRSIVEAHNGHLTMTESDDGLTTFHVDLPTQPQQAVTV